MRSDIVPGGIFPDYQLPDHTGELRKLSELQGDDPLILTLARGHYCPKEHQQHLELAAFYPKIAVAYTQIATIATDDHYRLKELATDNEWKTLSTRVTYEGYLRKWIVPRWGATNLNAIRAVEVEMWLRTLPLARASRTKIRNLMSVLFKPRETTRLHRPQSHHPCPPKRKAAHCARSSPAFRNQPTRSQFA
jgi:hypothetical protein